MDATATTGEAGRAGIGRVVSNLVDAIAQREDIDLTVLTLDSSTVPAGARAVEVRRRWRARRRAHYEHEFRLGWDLRNTAGDVFHSPAVDPPRKVGRPWVQTLYDVIPLVVDDDDLRDLRTLWQRWAPRYRNATAVVAISQFSADEGVRVLGLERDRVYVAPLGVGAEFTPGYSTRDGDEPYVLIVGEYGHRKGFDHAFAAVAAIADAGLPHRLRVAGSLRAHNEHELRALVAASPRPDLVDVLGYVDDIVALYRGADAVLVASRYEGFGLPALEAMACGVPVVAYDNSSLPEVVGDAGVLVPDGDVAQLATALRSVLTDRVRRDELIDAGVRRASTFTWARTAELTAEVYRAIAA
jgi:glycosyltransferase involved in cell wall biosynthesis